VTSAPELSQKKRYWIVSATIGLWMALGFGVRWYARSSLRSEPWADFIHLRIIYQLMGVPLLIGFQRFIAQRPLSEVWFRPPRWGPLPWWGCVLLGGWVVAECFRIRATWHWYVITRVGLICFCLGAIPAIYSLCRFPRSAVRPLLRCLLWWGLISGIALAGIAIALATGLASHVDAIPLHPLAQLRAHPGERLLAWAGGFLTMVCSCFVVEEVFFRGGLDSFLHRPGDLHPYRSAAFVSLLWGLWHLPFYSLLWAQWGMWNMVGALILFPLGSVMVGIPLSMGWRRSGLLLVPAAVHALGNSLAILLA